jgi:hypothetical protein
VTLREAEALLEQRRRPPRRWYPLSREEQRAIYLLQADKYQKK